MEKETIIDLSPKIIFVVSIILIISMVSMSVLNWINGQPIDYGTIVWMSLCLYFIN